jgi:hypothetical protein
VEGDGCKDYSALAVDHREAAIGRAQTGVSVPLETQLPDQLSKSGTLSASENGDGQRRVMRPLARPRLHSHASMVEAVEKPVRSFKGSTTTSTLYFWKG